MAHESGDSGSEGRPSLPIEDGFPIERVNEIAEKESRAKQWYRPLYTMHKWWARRPGCLFRAISLYSLLDENTDPKEVSVYEPGENQTLGSNATSAEELVDAIGQTTIEDPEPLWEFFPKDVRIDDKKVLDPFMGGGTSLVEASRFGVETEGYDLNPVAWFVTKKELEAGQTDLQELEEAFEQVKKDVSEEITQYYRTPCPNGDHEADVVYNFWVKELDCLSCGHTVPLFKDYRVAKERYVDDPGYNVLCPDCGAITATDDWQSESTCGECSYEWIPKEGHVSRGGYYNCPECGQKESITNGHAGQEGYDQRLFAVEYYCRECESNGCDKSTYKGYKAPTIEDKNLVEKARQDWEARTDLHQYVPDESIPEGHIPTDRNPIFDHGYDKWTDMFNHRQLLSLSLLMRSIDNVSDSNLRDYLLLTFGDSLMFQNNFSIYNLQRNNIEGIFRMNSFVPQSEYVENNVWGTEAGRGTFAKTFEKVKRGIEYAKSPTERYIEGENTVETAEFSQPVGRNPEVHQGDMRTIDSKDEYDMVLTDPPYYDNIIYSEISDYFYVWQKILLDGEYPGFDREKTPREESIVTNPFLEKTKEDFEAEIGQALKVINQVLKDDGTLAFTYHHSDEESWGELLASLCHTGFEVTATYPINSDLSKFHEAREAVAFDIVIVARPTDSREPISWNSLRRRIVRTAKDTRQTLEETRELSIGDIGVIEMGKCFQEYSKHHGEVHRAGDIMSAKEVVDEIYGIIQSGDRGDQDVYLDLIEEASPTYNALNKQLKRSDASEEQMKAMKLFETDGSGLTIHTWRDEPRQAYVQSKVEEDNGDLTTLDQAHFLRYRFEQGKSTSEYLERWDTTELQELCEGLAEATGDDTYLKMIDADTTLTEFHDDTN